MLDGAVRPAPDGTPVPHLYGRWDDPRGTDLCLYYPPDESMVLGHEVAEKLLPWAYEWLYYYEIWLVTGTWSGLEAPHAPGETPALVATSKGGVSSGRRLKKIDNAVMRSMCFVIHREHSVRSDTLAIAA